MADGYTSGQPTSYCYTHCMFPPERVSGLKSFIGAVKVLSRVIPGCASLLAPLDTAIAGRESPDHVNRSDELLASFQSVETAISSNLSVHTSNRKQCRSPDLY